MKRIKHYIALLLAITLVVTNNSWLPSATFFAGEDEEIEEVNTETVEDFNLDISTPDQEEIVEQEPVEVQEETKVEYSVHYVINNVGSAVVLKEGIDTTTLGSVVESDSIQIQVKATDGYEIEKVSMNGNVFTEVNGQYTITGLSSQSVNNINVETKVKEVETSKPVVEQKQEETSKPEKSEEDEESHIDTQEEDEEEIIDVEDNNFFDWVKKLFGSANTQSLEDEENVPEVEEHTVTFKVNNEVVSTQVTKQNVIVNLPENENVHGWVIEGTEQPFTSDFIVTEDITVVGVMEDDLTTYTVLINYVYPDGSQAAAPYTQTISKGKTAFVDGLLNPNVVGYAADECQGLGNAEDLTWSATEGFTSNIENVQSNITLTVVYSPADVNFKVFFYQENVENDDYTLVESDTLTLTGLTGTKASEAIGNIENKYEGFTQLNYVDSNLAADGTTEIEVYFNRNYYLMKFDLQGGYGVEPIYAKYGSEINVTKPTKAGYSFNTWKDKNGNAATLPTTMPAVNTDFTASWNADQNVTYTVVYWYENADDDDYSYAGTSSGTAKPGATLTSDNFKSTSFTGRDATHFTYNKDKKESVIVEGDGSTVVNVYFKRNTYTFTFVDSKKTVYTISKKYQSDISGIWTFKGTNGTSYPKSNTSWTPSGSKTYTQRITGMMRMPGENITFSHTTSSNGVRYFNYYVESLSGQKGVKTYNNKNYDLYYSMPNDFKQMYYNDDFYDLKGFTRQAVTKFSSNKDTAISIKAGGSTSTTTGATYNFYYTRNSYNLKFYNVNTYVNDKQKTIQYQASIGQYDFVPSYPTTFEPNAYQFDGWYLNPQCTGNKVDLSKATMPANDLVLYAKWVPVTHTVKIEGNQDQKVSHGSLATKVEDPTNGNMTFVGWFYKENGKEKAFDFDSTPVNRNLTIYAKWTSTSIVDYTINYQLEDGTVVATSTTGQALGGTSKTFEAKTGTQLSGEFQEGFFPETASHSITMDVNGNNTYTFIYKQAEAVPYTVRYLEKGTNTVLKQEKVVTDNRKAVVTERYERISGYVADEFNKTLIVSIEEDADNTITFYYTKDTKNGFYEVRHVLLDKAGNEVSTYKTSDIKGELANSITVTPLTINGYDVKESANVIDGTEKEVSLKDGKFTISDWHDGTEITVYYLPQTFTVTYKWDGQGEWPNSKDENGIYKQEEYGTGEKAYVLKDNMEMTGYTFSGWNYNVTVKNGSYTMPTADIEFTGHYKENSVQIIYEAQNGTVTRNFETVKAATGQAQGSTASANNGYYFVGWFKNNEPYSTEYTITPQGPYANGEKYVAVFAKKYEITMEANSSTGTYNGFEQSVEGFKQTTFEVDGNIYSVEGLSASIKGTNAGTYEAKVTGTAVVRDAAGNDVTGKFVVKTKNGKVTINKASLTITTESASRNYNGQALTATGNVSGLVNGEAVEFVVTGSQTNVGTSQNTYTIKFKEDLLLNGLFNNTVTASKENYEITSISQGTLEVNATKVTVVANSSSIKYGEELPELTATVTGVVEGESIDYQVTRNDESVNAGTYEIVVSGDKDQGNYKVSYTNGTLRINKRLVVMTSGSSQRAYNGKALTNSNVEETEDGFVQNEGATYNVTGSQTLVGSSANSFTYTLNEGTLASNYDIQKVEGLLNVTNRDAKYEITVEANSGTATYDGIEKSVDGLKSTTFEVEGNTYTVEGLSANTKATNAGTYTVNVVGQAIVKDSQGQDVTSQFSVLTKAGSLVINPRQVTMTSGSASKTYDGTPLTNNEVNAEGFIENEGATYTTIGTQTEVGTSYNEFTYTLNEGTLSSNYVITKVNGTLEVKEYDGLVTITTTGGTFTYDGQAHGATVKVSTLPTGYSVEKAVSNDIATHVSEGTITANCDELIIRNVQGEDVTSKLIIEYVDGSIQITPATLTVTTPTTSKVYDGTALTAAGSIEGFVAGEIASFQTTGSQVSVGTSDNKYSLEFDQTAQKTDYTVNATVGTLTVTQNKDEIVVTTVGGTFTYDGQAHSANVTTSKLPAGYTVETKVSNATITNVGSIEANCDTLVIRNNEGKDVTSELNIRYVPGTIKVTPATLTVNTPDASKEYDGTALTAAGTYSGLVNGETITFKTVGSQTVVGSSENKYEINWDNATESNYTVNATLGTLTVSESTTEITVTTTGGTFTYDGQVHKATVEVTNVPTGYTVETATSSASSKDVTTQAIEATCDTVVIKNAEGQDVTSKLNVKYENGSIVVNPATLTIVMPSDSKVYDGTPLTKEGSISGFVNEETATFTTIGYQTAVGTSENKYKLEWNGTAKETNYTINETKGSLTVTENAKEIVVTTTGGTFSYDGLEHKATVQVSELPAGYSLVKASSNDAATDVTTEAVEATCDELVIVNKDGQDVTSKLNITLVPGTIEITPATLTVVTSSASKVYDGTPLTATGSIEGFVNNESATLINTGSQTIVGSSENKYEINWDNAKVTNYTVNETIGTLTVTENTTEITVTTTGGTFTYDGQAHGATVSVSTLPAGYKLETATSDDIATHVAEGIVEATCDTLVIKNVEGEDVTAKLNIKYTNGTIKITPATLTVVTPSDSKIYNGTPLTKQGSIEGFVNDETATFTTIGTITNVGSTTNEFEIDWNGTATSTDYVVNKTLGTLSITENADEIVVTTIGGTFEYDGQAHQATVSVSTLPAGYSVEKAVSNDTATHVSEGTVTANCDELVIVNKDGKDVTSKLNIRNVNSSITITAKELTVVTPDASKVYDGTALTAQGSISGFVKDESATFQTTGTQTAVGTSDNTYSLKFDQNAQKDDYTVKETVGTLTVTENTTEITVTTIGGTFTYDGQAHGAQVQVSELPTGYTLEKAVSKDTATHVSEGTVTANCDELIIRNAEGKDVTSKLNIKYVDSTITITPATLTIVTESDSKVYDGEALTAQGSITGFVEGETSTFTVIGSQTEVGNSKNEYTLVFDGNAQRADYKESATIGTLVVTENTDEIVVTTTGGTFEYDGQAHGATVQVSTLPKGYTVEIATSDDTATHVSEGKVEATCDTLVIKNKEGKDVTSKLNITYVPGTIEITPTTLTVVTPGAEKVYDGTALTAAGTISGFVNNESATLNTTGSQTVVGNSENKYEINWDNAVETDYTVKETVGILTVSEYAEEITVTTTGGTFTYDGQAHGATVQVSQLPTGYTLETATSDDIATHVSEGTVTANCDELIIVNAEGEDVTSKLNIKEVEGTIEITPTTLTVVTPDAEKVYNGTALTANGSVTGYIGEETATFTTTGSQTKVGNSKNTYTLVFDQSAQKEDYTINETIGTLVVKESTDQIVVTITGGTFEYNGQAHKATVEVSTLPEGYTLETATSNDEATHVSEGTITANCDELVIRNAQGEDVTSALNIQYVNDEITITPAPLTITTNSAEKVYDGKELTATGKVEGLVNGETVDFQVTGTQTSVGSSENKYEINWNNAVETDYAVNKTVGTLTVTEYAEEITVTTTGGEFTYDGQEHAAIVEVSELPEGYELVSAKSNDKATHVTTSPVTANCDELIIVNAQGEDVTTKLNVKYVNDVIVINAATLTVVTPSDSKVYDGTALTAQGSIEGFVEGEMATLVTTGSRTKVGTSDNSYKIEWNGNALETDYTVKETIGKLTVSESTEKIIVTTVGGTFTYDGEEHKATVNVSPLPEGYTLVKAESKDMAKHVKDGKVKANCDELVIENADGEDVTSKLNIEYEEDTIEITPATLTVNTSSASKVYDGTELTAQGSITGFIGEEDATFEVIGTQTSVGSSDNQYSLVFNKNASELDYTVDEKVGTLTVSEYAEEITVTTTGGTFTYDGKEHKATVEVSTLPTGYTVETATSQATATNVTTTAVKAECDTLVIRNAQGEDVTSKLNVKYVNDEIVINQAPLTITTNSAEKVYDGKELTATGKVEGLVNGETVDFQVTGTQTTVGTSDNNYEIQFKDDETLIDKIFGNNNATALKTNYNITVNKGTLTVTENTTKITVTTTGGTFEYDGQAHGANVVTTQLPEGYTLVKAESYDTATHVSEGTVTANCDTLVIKNAQGEDVTAKLNIEYVDGSITITTKELTVTTPTDTKVYDGKALTKEGKVEGFVEGEKATFVTTGKQTKVGSSTNNYSLDFDQNAKATDYKVKENLGTLTVTENEDEIVVTTTGGTFEYDGQAHQATVSVSTLPAGYSVEKAVSNDTATHVSEGKITANCDELIIVNAEGEDVTSKLNVKYIDSSITITTKELTVVTPNASKVYDGTALTAQGSIEGFVKGEIATFTTIGKQTAVGSSKNDYSLVFDQNAKATDYKVNESVGTLTVTENTTEITVTTTGGTFEYNGQAHGATVQVSTLPEGYELVSAKSNDTASHVSEGTVTANCDELIIRNAQGEDVTSKLNVKYVDGSITITAKELTVTTPTDTKVYDGQALTKEGKVEGFVEGESATFTTTGKQTKVGSSTNNYSLDFDQNAKATDYKVNESLGTLTVTENEDEIVVTTTGGIFTYDGQAHGATVSVSTLPAGYRLENAESSDTATHVSEGKVEATCDTLVIKNAEGEDVTSKLNVTYIPGTIEITPATLTVVTPDASKVYDGTALTAQGSISGFVNNESATLNTTGSQTVVGNSENKYEINWDNAVETDYTVKETVGILTVSEYAEEITVTTTGGTFTYDGQAHGATVQVSQLPTGYTLETATSDDIATHVSEGTVTANCDELIIVNAEGEDVTSKLNIKEVEGTIEITPTTLTIVTPNASKEYDGTALKSEGSIKGFVEGETATFNTTGSQTEFGSSKNTYTLVFDQNADKSDYTVNETVGTLSITKQSIEEATINTPDSEVYDGQAHQWLPTVMDKQNKLLVKDTDYTVSYDTNNFTDVTTITVTIEGINNYTGTVTRTYQITKAPIEVSTGTASKVYDGESLTAQGSVTGIVKGETYTFNTTGSQVEVGSSKNSYSLEWNGTAKETNYELVKEQLGQLTVTESTNEIVVTTTGGTFTYDGQAHAATVQVGTLPKGYKVDVATSDDKATDVSTVEANCDHLVILNAQGKDVTAKLNIKYVNDEIVIEKATLTIVTPNQTKVYDGMALTAEGSITGFIKDEQATFTTTGSQTTVGQSENTYSLTFDQSAKQANYQLDEQLGTLKVVAQSINPEDTPAYIGATVSQPENTVYNGLVQEQPIVVVDGNGNTMIEGTDYTITYSEDVTNVGTVTVTITGIGNFTGTVTRTYQITKAPVTITTDSASKTYDGQVLVADGRIEGIVNNETYSFTVTGSQLTQGSSQNTYEMIWASEDNTFTSKESNYQVTTSVGTLTISTQSISDSEEKVHVNAPTNVVYDGNAHQWLPTVVDDQGKTLTENEDYTVTYNTDNFTDVTGTIKVTITGINNYTGVVERTYKVTPKAIQIETENASKVYDGEVLVADGTITGIVEGETYTFNTTGSQVEVGTSENTYSLVWNGTAKESNYELTSKVIGKLTVTEFEDEIVVTTTGGTFTYDGEKHKATVEVSALPKGYTLVSAKSKDAAKDVEDGKVEANCDELIIVNAQNKDVTSKLNVTYVNDEITITPATLTVVTPDATKVYDGMALTKDGSIKGFVKDEAVTFTTTGAQTEVGTSQNTYEIKWTNAKESNYKVEETVGTLKVTKQSIDPEDTPAYTGATVSQPENTVYNGLVQEQPIVVVDGNGNTMVEGTDYTVTYSEATNVGTVTVTIKGKGNYTGTVTRTYKITPATVKVVTDSAIKVYDGESLTASGTITGFVNNEEAKVITTGSQVEVGTSQNTYEINWTNAKESNYKVEEVLGTLIVVSQSIDPEDPSDPSDPETPVYSGATVSQPEDTVYNGLEQLQEIVVTDAQGNILVEGTDYVLEYTEAINAGEVTVTVTGIGNYAGIVTRTYNITKATLTVVTESASKTYDGSPLTANGTIKGFVNNETATFTVTGSRTLVGRSDNTYSITWDGTALESNYEIIEELGTLTVNNPPQTIFVTPSGPSIGETPVEIVEDPTTPAAILDGGVWALVNLICLIITALLGIILLLSRHSKDADEEEQETVQATEAEEEETPQQKRRRWTKVFSVIVFLVSAIVFFLTEDMTLPMVLIDNWTIVMVVIALIQLVTLIIGRKYKDAEEEEEEVQQA